ncbi:ribonuclease III [Spiroplasma helicoides]|uniref:Ribonuclease 3 n=1 Tax=Spiroplasma helicoides TaxID=216938 RepID=A0A1B3SLB6_9MOLU|nr:ribonuclease III [Spiroplasma helicoides]AOG60712.1 ribonuclease III [Spiroplasma helicoides]
MKEFFNRIGIEIKNQDYFNEAFTHNSFSNENRLSKNYQRLEFLGDAILQFKVSEFLYKKYPKSNEGTLTKYRSSIVRQVTLAHLAKSIGLGKFIRLGIGEQDAKGYEKESILSDVFESVTAAIHLDSGNDAVDKWLKATMFSDKNIDFILESIRDYKSELQELIQVEMRNDLAYSTIEQQKLPDNRTIFKVQCTLDGMIYGIGEGFSKKQAEQEAAKSALSKIKKTI